MSKAAVTLSYTQSLLWLALFIALARVEAFVVELLLADFMQGNPHRPQQIAMVMIGLAIIAILGTLLVFALPQLFQAVLTGAFEPQLGDQTRFTPLMILPVTAVLTWYCYDYLTPSNLCFAGNCMSVYEHGISAERYLAILSIQAPITLFSFFYFDAGLCGRPKARVLLVALATAIIAGLIWGYLRAHFQLQDP